MTRGNQGVFRPADIGVTEGSRDSKAIGAANHAGAQGEACMVTDLVASSTNVSHSGNLVD